MALVPIGQKRQALSLAIDRTNPDTLPASSDTLEFVRGMESAARLDELHRDGWEISTGPLVEGQYTSYLLVRPLIEVD